MSGEVSPTRQSLDSMIPGPCDCTAIENFAKALSAAVDAGQMTYDEALEGFSSTIDPNCQGKKENECQIVGCGSPEKVCGHGKGALFLLGQTMKLRESL